MARCASGEVFSKLFQPLRSSLASLVKSLHALSPTPGMARLRRLLHYPFVLADGASESPALARTRGFAVPRAGPGMDGHVDWHRRTDRPVEERRALLDAVDMGSSGGVICCRDLHLFALRSALQLGAARRPARSPRREPAAAARDHRNSVACPASGLSRAPLRDAGLERGDRSRRLLAADRVRDCYGRGYDSDGGCGARKKVRG